MYQTARAQLEDGQYDAAAADFDRIAKDWPTSPWVDDAIVGKLRVAEARGEHAAALELAQQFETKFPDSPSIAEARLTKAHAQAALGQLAAAGSTIVTLAGSAPLTPALAELCYRTAESAFAGGDTKTAEPLFTLLAREGNSDEALGRGLAGLGWCQFKADDFREAAETFAQLLARFPDHPSAAEAGLVRGRALEKLNDLEPALVSYRAVVEKHASSPRVADAMYAAARLCDKLQKPDEAVELYSRLVKEHADFAQADAAIHRWASLIRDKDRAASDELFERLRRDYPNSPFASDSTLRLAERALAEKDAEEAQRLLAEATGADAPAATREAALFLKGRAAAAAGDWAAVEETLGQLISEFPASQHATTAAYLRREQLSSRRFRSGRRAVVGGARNHQERANRAGLAGRRQAAPGTDLCAIAALERSARRRAGARDRVSRVRAAVRSGLSGGPCAGGKGRFCRRGRPMREQSTRRAAPRPKQRPWLAG